MTRDEVMAMTDEELRIKAAELMGFTEIAAGAFDDLWGYLPENDEGRGERTEIADYPNDIAAAWELTKFEHKTWSFLARLLDERPGHDRYMIYNVMLKTTPQEIVRAFILAMADKEATD